MIIGGPIKAPPPPDPLNVMKFFSKSLHFIISQKLKENDWIDC